MKIKLLVMSLCLIGMITVFNGCKKDSDSATTAGLIVKVKLDGASGFQAGVHVGLSNNATDFANGVYIQSKISDASGQVDFGQLNAGTYWFDGNVTISGTDYTGIGGCVIIAGHDQTQTMTLY